MDYLVALFIVYLLLLIMSLFFESGRLTSPSVIMLTSFCVMFGLSIVCYDHFQFNIHPKTFWIMSLSALVFVMGEILVGVVYVKNKICIKRIQVEKILIDKVWVRIIFIFSALALVFSIYVVMQTSGGSWTDRMFVYKTKMISDPDSIPFRFLLAQIYKIDLAIIHVLGYVVIYNIVTFKDHIRDNIINFASMLLFIIFAFISQGARQPVIEYIVYLGILYVLLKEHDQKSFVTLFVVKVTLLVFLLGYLFFYTMVLSGRIFHEGKSVILYVAEYFCGGLYKFNEHIEEAAKSAYFGRQSFMELYSFFAKLHLMDSSVNFQPDFDKFGNTSTMYGHWYEDFGIMGLIVMVGIVSVSFSIYYNKLKRTIKNSKKMHRNMIFYSYLVIALVWAGYDDRIVAIVSMNTIMKLLLIYLFFQFIINRRIRFGSW